MTLYSSLPQGTDLAKHSEKVIVDKSNLWHTKSKAEFTQGCTQEPLVLFFNFARSVQVPTAVLQFALTLQKLMKNSTIAVLVYTINFVTSTCVNSAFDYCATRFVCTTFSLVCKVSANCCNVCTIFTPMG